MHIYIYIYIVISDSFCVLACHKSLRICGDPTKAHSRCTELIECLLRRGPGRRRTQLEIQRAIVAYRYR